MTLRLTAEQVFEKTITATVTASPTLTPGTIITISASRWNGMAGPQAWTPIGTIVAGFAMTDTLTETLDSRGAWLLVATVDTPSAVFSNWFYLPVIDDGEEVFVQCEEGVAAQIRRLNLPKIGDRVYTQLVPHELLVEFPCVFCVSSDGLETVDADGLNATESIGHPVRVLIATKEDIHDEEVRRWLWKCRGRIRRAFSKQRLPDVPAVRWTTVEPGPRFQQATHPSNMAGQAYYMFASSLIVRCSTREFRGFGQ